MFLEPLWIWNKKAFASFKKFFKFTLLKIWATFDLGWFQCGNRRNKYKAAISNLANLENLTKQAICNENSNKHTCIDLILTNFSHIFQSTCVSETGLWFSSNNGDSYAENFQENESFSKEMMTGLRLKYKYLKHKVEENRLVHTQERNKCLSLLRKTEKINYRNLHETDITNNKKIWKTVKPFLPDKPINSDKTYLNENGELINRKCKTAEVLNEFF